MYNINKNQIPSLFESPLHILSRLEGEAKFLIKAFKKTPLYFLLGRERGTNRQRGSTLCYELHSKISNTINIFTSIETE